MVYLYVIMVSMYRNFTVNNRKELINLEIKRVGRIEWEINLTLLFLYLGIRERVYFSGYKH